MPMNQALPSCCCQYQQYCLSDVANGTMLVYYLGPPLYRCPTKHRVLRRNTSLDRMYLVQFAIMFKVEQPECRRPFGFLFLSFCMPLSSISCGPC